MELTLLGGFCGAGKTALLAAAGRRLAEIGHTPAAILCDHAARTIDACTIAAAGLPVLKLVETGPTPRPQDVLAAAAELEASGARRAFVELPPLAFDHPAKLVAPLRQLAQGQFAVGSLAVAVDPARALEAFIGGDAANLPEEVYAVYRRQLAEAELLLLNKSDAVPPLTRQRLSRLLEIRFPDVPRIEVSAVSGDGVDAWLAVGAGRALSVPPVAPDDALLLDRGAAALAWVGASAEAVADGAVDWRRWTAGWLLSLQNEVGGMETEIAHAVVRVAAEDGQVIAHLVANDGQPLVAGRCASERVALWIDVRAHLPKHLLRQIVERTLRQAGDTVDVTIRGWNGAREP